MKKTIVVIVILIVMLLLSVSAYAIEANEAKITTNGYTTFLIESNGTVKGWGWNSKGEVGIESTVNQLTPMVIPELTNIKEIITNDSGYGFFFAIDNDGKVYTWGYNGYGQLGLGNTSNQSKPILIPNLPNVSQVTSKGNTAYAITTDGDVYAWGQNNYGQVGNNSLVIQKTPVKLTQLSNIVNITCGKELAYAIDDTGKVYSWGRGNSGQIGNNTYVTAQKTPVEVIGLSDVDEIIANTITTFALCQNGKEVYAWGEGPYGELGCYSTSRKLKPTLVPVISDVQELLLAQNTVYAILEDGTLYGWGRNGYNQLADGGSFDKGYPRQITGVPKINQIISNGYSTCALGVDNSVYAWGYNQSGEVGNGTTTRQSYAYKISSINNIEQIISGGSSIYAIDFDGVAYGWGRNDKGQLGIGTISLFATPVAIPELTDIVEIQKTVNTVYAKDSQDTIYSWGDNKYGQVGNNTIETVFSPIVIFENVLKLATTMGTGDVNSVVPIMGSINALTISVTHPANVAYTIDPNNENGFYTTNIDISNHSKVPVRITIESFKSSTEGGLQFIDVLPDSRDWDNLSLEESKSYISLGLQYVNQNEWLISEPLFINPVYAFEIDNASVGALAKGTRGALQLTATHGLAFDRSYHAKHHLVLVFSLL